ncbi:hypothetical protein NEUTE2DRAFT_125735 [Neurospora tetrasperma FGSC 2509]|nr:hypothetical protein NEUTE2DRAFT_125735 [Neurospora tetrasperma FGSC 2509]
MAATSCRVSSEPLAVVVDHTVLTKRWLWWSVPAGVRPASRATARTGWRDATSRPSLSRGHLASAESSLYEKDSGTVTGEREEDWRDWKSGKIQQAKSPICSVNQEEVLKAFRPKPTAESSTPIQKKSDPIWT